MEEDKVKRHINLQHWNRRQPCCSSG